MNGEDEPIDVLENYDVAILRLYIVTLASGQQYRFQAEDEDRARLQAEEAEPGNPVVSIDEE
jgi:hypothetical protein